MRTNAEWVELIDKLEAILHDPKETPARKKRAGEILNDIDRPSAPGSALGGKRTTPDHAKRYNKPEWDHFVAPGEVV